MLERLLDSTYSALDRDPHGQTAFRAQHADGLKWSVKDRVLTASTELDAPLLVLPLRDLVLSDVTAALIEAGCSLVYSNPDLVARAADSLLAGSGRQSQSNGDAFAVYDSLLWSMLDSYAVVLESASVDVDLAIKQLYLGTAENDWLDVWGDYFSLPRDIEETDTAYRIRIIVETLRPRVNEFAIEKAIFDLTGNVVDLYEPWKDLFILGESELSGGHFMQDGSFYTYNIVQPRTKAPINWTRPLQIIDRNRPAGTVITAPAFFPDAWHVSLSPAMLAALSRHDVQSSVLDSIDVTALDYLALSDYVTPLNYRANIYQVRALANLKGANNDQLIGKGLFFAKDHLCLSQDFALGDLNSRFGHFYVLDTSPPMLLSGSDIEEAYTLSDSVHSEDITNYDEVFLNLRGTSVESELIALVSCNRAQLHSSIVPGRLVRRWSGSWGPHVWLEDRIYSSRTDIPLA